MQVPWAQDERPVWLLGFLFAVSNDDGEQQQDGYRGRRLARTLELMDAVRGPQSVNSGGRLALSMFVRGVDEDDATQRGLSFLDVAAAQVPGLRLGELLERWVIHTTIPTEVCPQ
jgi:hypothetical protein